MRSGDEPLNPRMASQRDIFDVESYAARYAGGHGKAKRLQQIALCAIGVDASGELGLEALRMAVDEAKQGDDTALYRELIAQGEDKLGPAYALDEGWIEQKNRQAAAELERLRQDLEECENQHNKEVVRAGHNNLGDFFYRRGKLANARGEYMKTKDYCSVPKHTIQMCMNVVKVSIEIGDYNQVETYVAMAETIPDAEKLSLEIAKVRCCAGLAMLARGIYIKAAGRFLSVKIGTSEEEMGDFQKGLADIMSLEDVAVYGGLCALATMSRKELKSEVLDNVVFRNFLETMPEIRELIQDFYGTKYSSCLDYLAKMKPDFMLDPYLGNGEHLQRLYKMIRRRALVQYIDPFVTVDLNQMASTFNCSKEDLESELFTLIESGGMNVRIDTQGSSLVRKKEDVRAVCLSEAVLHGQATFNEAEGIFLRMNLLRNGICLRPPGAGDDHRGGLGSRNPSLSSAGDPLLLDDVVFISDYTS